jgi:arylsulfatase A-like enzyme
MVTLFLDKPFATPEDFRYAQALYDGEINYVDSNLARLFAQLDQLGLASSTLVVLTSDHGEEFKDHDSMGHQMTLYREQLHVPFILSYPDRVAAGQKIAVPVSPIDIMPTVLALLGREPYEGAQGIDLTPYLRMKDAKSTDRLPEPRELFAELGPLGSDWTFGFRRKVVRNNNRKLIVNYLPQEQVTKELYTLTDDPHEKHNVYLSEKDEDETRLLEAHLEAFHQKGLAYKSEIRGKNQIEVDETTRERLRALGYVQ